MKIWKGFVTYVRFLIAMGGKQHRDFGDTFFANWLLALNTLVIIGLGFVLRFLLITRFGFGILMTLVVAGVLIVFNRLAWRFILKA